MKLLTILTFLCFSILSTSIFASMICPPSKTIYCDDDIHDLYLTGKPTLLGSHKFHTPKYVDQNFTNVCNVGHVIRRWYIDLNYNDVPDQYEPTCYQDIYIKNINYPFFEIVYPKDITVACEADIPDTSPSILNGPCDIVGVNVQDQVFVLVGSPDDGCRKILRKFTVINWCEPTKTYTGTQVIKIVDKEKPILTQCKDVTIGFNQGCKAKVTLTNAAKDEGACASVKLQWFVDVDLYADGVIDYTYSNAQSGIFNLPLTSNEQPVSLTIPDLLGNGLHKVVWKVKDSCGNLTTCNSTFTTKDNKSPTPYCYASASVGVQNDGSDLKIPARMFNLGAYDNCTPSQFIRFAFSKIPTDSLVTIDCKDAGFVNLDVYAIDLAGNAGFCKVALRVYDNSGCNGNITFGGKVMSPSGRPIKSAEIRLEANEGLFNLYENISEGSYSFSNTSLYNDTKLIPTRSGIEPGQIDLSDYFMLKEYVKGLDTLSNVSMLAADINEDKRVNAKDLQLLQNFIKNGATSFGEHDWKFVPNYVDINTLQLKHYSPIYETQKYKGSLDFIAIAKGDLLESIQDNTAENRSAVSLVPFDDVVINNKTYTPYGISQDVLEEGMYFDISTLGSVIPSDIFNFDMISNEKHYRISNFDKLELKKEDILFYVEKQSNTIDGKMIQNDGHIISLSVKTNSTGFALFPNPATQDITISSAVPQSISIVSLDGKLINTFEVSIGKSTIDVRNLYPGIYLVKHGSKIEKFVKQ